jgi:integration host factor subunit beta
MTRKDLIDRLAARDPTLPVKDAERIVRAIFEAMAQQLVAGGTVELRRFGTFSTRARVGRLGRNPRTGKVVEVGPSRVVYFRLGEEMRKRVNSLRARDRASC